MNRAKIVLSVGLACWLVVASAAAQEHAAPAPAPDLEELVREALERSAELATLRARAQAAQHEVSPAGAMPDPMLELMREQASFTTHDAAEAEESMLGVELRQTFPFPGKRGARREAMGAEATSMQREVELMERELVVRVRVLYATLYAQDRAQQSLVAARELVDLLAATVVARYSSGEGSFEEQLKTQVESERIAEQLDDLASERAATEAQLNRLLDRPVGSRFGAVLSLPELTVPAEPWEALALQHSPRIATQNAQVVAAGLWLESARREQAPDFSAGVGYASMGGPDDVVTFRVGIELPFWRGQKQKPLVGAAQSQVHAAEHELRDARAVVLAEVLRLRAEWQRSEKQVLRYREAILPQTSAAFEAARAAYAGDVSDFSTVIEDYQSWLEARIELAQREAQRFVSWAEIQALLAPRALQEDQP